MKGIEVAKKLEGLNTLEMARKKLNVRKSTAIKIISLLRKEGFVVLSDEPKKGADNKLVCFIHPKSANGVLIELCQEIK